MILGVVFTGLPRVPAVTRSIDVTLAQHSDERAPEHADFHAPRNQLGSGTLAEVRETTTTEVSEFNDNVIREVLPEPSLPEPQPELRADVDTEVLTTAAVVARQAQPDIEQPALESEPLRNLANLDLASEIATLQARLADERQTYARMPRVRRLTSVSTRSTADAYYLNAWRRKVETIGNLNYPAEARRQKLFGSLRLLVAIRPDGSLAEVRVLDSSGHKVLDTAALDIVRLAAPFSPFPDELARDTDLLEIIRTWQFRPNSYFTDR